MGREIYVSSCARVSTLAELAEEFSLFVPHSVIPTNGMVGRVTAQLAFEYAPSPMLSWTLCVERRDG
jgi:hypothetical protein